MKNIIIGISLFILFSQNCLAYFTYTYSKDPKTIDNILLNYTDSNFIDAYIYKLVSVSDKIKPEKREYFNTILEAFQKRKKNLRMGEKSLNMDTIKYTIISDSFQSGIEIRFLILDKTTGKKFLSKTGPRQFPRKEDGEIDYESVDMKDKIKVEHYQSMYPIGYLEVSDLLNYEDVNLSNKTINESSLFRKRPTNQAVFSFDIIGGSIYIDASIQGIPKLNERCFYNGTSKNTIYLTKCF